eukprot:2570416-Lingulodinium_polyedra.AAC.1
MLALWASGSPAPSPSATSLKPFSLTCCSHASHAQCGACISSVPTSRFGAKPSRSSPRRKHSGRQTVGS